VHTACNVMTERLMSLTDRPADCRGKRTASGDITVRLNSTCWYQSITQQYLKRCSINNVKNYMFRPNVSIIRFPSESMLVVIYRIGMVMSRWWDLIFCDDCYMLLLRATEGICDVRYPGVCSCSMSARCCPVWVSSYCLSIPDVYCCWVNNKIYT